MPPTPTKCTRRVRPSHMTQCARAGATPASSSTQSTMRRAASGRASPRIAVAIASRLRPVGQKLAGHAASLPAVKSRSSITTAAPASANTCAFLRWWSSVAAGNGISTAGRPAAASSASVVAPARQITRSAAHHLRYDGIQKPFRSRANTRGRVPLRAPTARPGHRFGGRSPDRKSPAPCPPLPPQRPR